MGPSKKELPRLVEVLPAFPPSACRILKLTSDINCPPKEIVRILDQDPPLARQLLHLINAPRCGLAEPVVSIRQAVVIVGINTIKNLALTVAPIEMLGRDSERTPFLEGQLSHAFAVGLIARQLARRLGLPEGETHDCFMAGLLHDYGKIVLHRLFPARYKKALAMAIKKQRPLHETERELFKLDHLGVGALLAEKWKLSPHCALAMGRHHLPDDPESDSPLPDCVHAANIIAKTVGLGASGNPRIETTLPESVARRLDGTLPELIGSLGEIPAEMHKVQLFLNAWNATPADSACEPP